jgi:hypothetical protein
MLMRHNDLLLEYSLYCVKECGRVGRGASMVTAMLGIGSHFGHDNSKMWAR